MKATEREVGSNPWSSVRPKLRQFTWSAFQRTKLYTKFSAGSIN